MPLPPTIHKTSGGGLKPPTPPYVFEQYAGAIEFSAPEGVVYLPRWMMENVRLREGSRGAFSTVRSADLPSGTFVKFRARSQTFLELAHAVGPREVLEAAMRNYTVLSLGERLLVEVAGDKHFLDVVEVRPGTAISVLGNVDLEVEFAPLVGSPEEAAEKAASVGAPGAPLETSSTPSLSKDPSRGKENEDKTLLARGIAPTVQKPGMGVGSVGGGEGRGESNQSGVVTPRKPAPAGGGPASKIPAPRVSPGTSTGGVGGGSPTKIISATASPSSPPLLRSLGSSTFSKTSPPTIPLAPLSSSETSPDLAASENPWDDMFPGMGEMLKRNAVPACPSLNDLTGSVLDVEPSTTSLSFVDPKISAAEDKSRALEVERERGVRAAAALLRCEGNSGDSSKDVPSTPSPSLTSTKPVSPTLEPSLPTSLHQTFVKAVMPTISPSESKEGELEQCPHCSALVPNASFSLHTARCARSDDLHKFSCTLCSPSFILRKKEFPSHAHCTACNQLVIPFEPSEPPLTKQLCHLLHTASVVHASSLCPLRSVKCGGDVALGKPSTGCAALVPAVDLEAHRLSCPAALEPCPFCKLTVKRGGVEAHQEKCGSRTADCDVCGKRIVLKHMAAHVGSALCALPTAAPQSVTVPTSLSDSGRDSNSGIASINAVGGGIKAIRAAASNASSTLPVASNLQKSSAGGKSSLPASLPPKKPASSSRGEGGLKGASLLKSTVKGAPEKSTN